MEKILVTGGCGFVGSNLAVKLKEQYPDVAVVAFDNLKRRGSELNVKRLLEAGVQFVHGDIRFQQDIFEVGPIDLIVDAAAEPSVHAGMDGSTDYLVQTNLNGTINCLNLARSCGAGFIYLSTSRVYPIERICEIGLVEEETRFAISKEQKLSGVSERGITSSFTLEGHRTLYGATKLCSEHMVNEYREAFGIRTIINRCGVIAGPYQMGKVDQGFAVLWMARHLWKQPLGYFGYDGTGKQVRDLVHIDDMFDLICAQINGLDKYSGRTFNAGGGISNSVSLMELTAVCEKITGNIVSIKKVKETASTDIPIYVTDNSEISECTGWIPKCNVEEVMSDIYAWLRANENVLKPILT